MAVRVFNPVAPSEVFELCVCVKILFKLCSCIHEIKKNLYRKMSKLYFNFTFCFSQDSLPEICPRPYRGTEVPFTQFLTQPCEPPPLWNTGYADGETHLNYHPFKALGWGSSTHTVVMWGHLILDIICHVICTKYCHNFLIKRYQCRHNCRHHEPYFTLICTKSNVVDRGSGRDPAGGANNVPRSSNCI